MSTQSAEQGRERNRAPPNAKFRNSGNPTSSKSRYRTAEPTIALRLNEQNWAGMTIRDSNRCTAHPTPISGCQQGGAGGRTSLVDVVDLHERGRNEHGKNWVGDGLAEGVEEEKREERAERLCAVVASLAVGSLERAEQQDALVARTVNPPTEQYVSVKYPQRKKSGKENAPANAHNPMSTITYRSPYLVPLKLASTPPITAQNTAYAMNAFARIASSNSAGNSCAPHLAISSLARRKCGATHLRVG